MPRISVIVPVYNVEPYLQACLASLRSQTFADIEILCIDDASTDTSPALLSEAAVQDNRIKIIRHASNRGLSAARNTGIRAASAPWVLFVDSDDIVSARICERTLDAARQSRADVLFFSHAVFHDSRSLPPEPAVCEPVKADRKALLERSAFAWTKLVRTSLLRTAGIEFPEGLCFEDVPVHWRLVLESENPVFLDEALVWYRQRPGSITFRTDWTRADGIKVYDLIGKRLQAEGRWQTYGAVFMAAEMANFANTHAYFVSCNYALVSRVREEARRRMTDAHWALALRGEGLLGWQRDFILSKCRPNGAILSPVTWLSSLRSGIRDCLRRLKYLLWR